MDELLSLASAAVGRGGELLRNSEPGSVTMKGDRDPATEVDYSIEKEIQKYLSRAEPEIEFLGEEFGASAAGESEWMWTLDPVDGTVNFVHGIPLCGVSLALVHEGQAVLGVLEFPFLAQRYTAVRGQGAYCGKERLQASNERHLRDAVVSLGDYAVGSHAQEKNRDRFKVTENLAGEVARIRMFGAASIDLAWLARGALDVTVTLSNKPWDMAAGTLLAREAGAVVVDRQGRSHTMQSDSTVALSPGLVSQVIPLVR